MSQATWRVGWYSKIILAVIAVGLATLLIRWMPIRIEAKQSIGTDFLVVQTTSKGSLSAKVMKKIAKRLGVWKDISNRSEKVGYEPDYGLMMVPDLCLEILLEVLCDKGYEIKFATSDFIILEK